MSKYVVGLTGGIATGKTNISDALIAHGACVVDADEISRSLTAKGGAALPLIREAFGDEVFCDSGELDRKALGQLIFADEAKRSLLNRITHPLIIEECKRQIEKTSAPIVILSAPLLYECGMEKMCGEVWCTYVPLDEQLRRIMQRDGADMDYAVQKARSQMPAREKAARADHMITTSLSREESAMKAVALYDALLAKLASA